MKHIGTMAACCAALILSSCSHLKPQSEQAPAPEPISEGGEQSEPKTEPTEDKPNTANSTENETPFAEPGLTDAIPSDEQQEAARAMLQQQGEAVSERPIVTTDSEIPDPVDDSVFGTPQLPGSRGLRMGNLAPPEEAASSGDNAPPKPNSVELRGLRSPSLPKSLPMDINGKLTPTD